VVVEADPAGGDLAFRFGRRREPGLSELAADTRGGGPGRELSAYLQRIPLGVDVVFAPADQQSHRDASGQLREPGQSVQVVRLVAGTGVGLLRSAAAGRLVVVDVGRLGWDSPAVPLVACADVLLLASRCTVEAIDAVSVRRDRLLALPGMRASVRLVPVGRLPCSAREVADAVGLPVAGVIPEDRRGAAVLTGRAWPGRGWTRLELLRAARAIALQLYDEVPADAGPVGRRVAPAVVSAARPVWGTQVIRS
jgi:hypothetical protein